LGGSPPGPNNELNKGGGKRRFNWELVLPIPLVREGRGELTVDHRVLVLVLGIDPS